MVHAVEEAKRAAEGMIRYMEREEMSDLYLTLKME